MHFKTIKSLGLLPSATTNAGYLCIDNWDDYGYKTQFFLVVFDSDGKAHEIGSVKIACFGLDKGQGRIDVPDSFERLAPDFFSLGQSAEYYSELQNLGTNLRLEVLKRLRDVAYNLSLFEKAINEPVTGVSLLRTVPKRTVRGQFNRLAKGGTRLIKYAFSYEPYGMDGKLDFHVDPDASPPTNIHVIVGRNGVGKTTILHNMSRALIEETERSSDVGKFSVEEWFSDVKDSFSNVVSVSFSAFDSFEPLRESRDKSKGMQYAYIGLKKRERNFGKSAVEVKTPELLATDFSKSVKVCIQRPKKDRWIRALQTLQSDPMFSEIGVERWSTDTLDDTGDDEWPGKIYRELSSGHKIVLLTVTRLVETVEERTLVLIDEPEAHLHPPLLSAFVRALSELLIDRNGVAVVATHSPVVVQEVPSECVWKVRRVGPRLFAERPEIQTFGENVGVLTREIFGLEVTESGFHTLLKRKSKGRSTYSEVDHEFEEKLGGEAQAIMRGMIATSKADDEV